MNKVRITNLEKKLNTATRKHREIKLVDEDTKGVYTTRDGRPLTKTMMVVSYLKIEQYTMMLMSLIHIIRLA